MFNRPGEYAVVSQHNNVLWMTETVRYHLDFYFSLSARNKEDRETVIKEILKAFDLGAFIKVKAYNLSGGNKRKLALAIALISKPRFLVMDEVSAGLDPISRRKIM